MTATKLILKENPDMDKVEMTGVSLKVFTGATFKLYKFNSLKVTKKVKSILEQIL